MLFVCGKQNKNPFGLLNVDNRKLFTMHESPLKAVHPTLFSYFVCLCVCVCIVTKVLNTCSFIQLNICFVFFLQQLSRMAKSVPHKAEEGSH